MTKIKNAQSHLPGTGSQLHIAAGALEVVGVEVLPLPSECRPVDGPMASGTLAGREDVGCSMMLLQFKATVVILWHWVR